VSAPARPSLGRRLRDYLVDSFSWRKIDAESGLDTARRGFDWRVLVVLVVCAMSLTVQEYVGSQQTYTQWFPQVRGDQYYELKTYAWWSGWRVLGYVAIPIIAILCMPGERLRDYNLSLKGFWKHLPLYLAMFALFFPVLVAVSKTESFTHTYPFYKKANRSYFDLIAWEIMYVLQFLSLEFFFRGFLLQGVRRQLGVNALFVMIIPYCMIHYGKPLPETIGAILAGILLGTMAMRARSIWGGVIIHVLVAVTMDLLSVFGACPPFGGARSCPR
jgi:membrane protease YdiL (CAAX protease family)